MSTTTTTTLNDDLMYITTMYTQERGGNVAVRSPLSSSVAAGASPRESFPLKGVIFFTCGVVGRGGEVGGRE